MYYVTHIVIPPSPNYGSGRVNFFSEDPSSGDIFFDKSKTFVSKDQIEEFVYQQFVIKLSEKITLSEDQGLWMDHYAVLWIANSLDSEQDKIKVGYYNSISKKISQAA